LSTSDDGSLDIYAITVLGVGNPIMGDDGVGLEILTALQATCEDPRVEFVDGTTGGLDLLPTVQDASRLLVLDAVVGDVPGEVVVLVGDQIPRLLSTKLSPHQVGLLDIFAAARLLDAEPSEIVVVGVVPDMVEINIGLSDPVEAAVPEAVRRAMDVIESWLEDLES